MLSIRKTVVVAIAFGLLVAFSGAAAGHGGGAGSGYADAGSELAEVRQATVQYHDVGNAVTAGYGPTDHCVPGMGYHYVNPTLVDNAVEATQPEVLLYAPTATGLELVAVEYLSTEPFSLFGQDAEYSGHLGLYALHAWIWQGNPDGVFAHFNPTIECPVVEVPDEGHTDGDLGDVVIN